MARLVKAQNLIRQNVINALRRCTALPILLPLLIHTLAGANDMRHAVSVLMVGGETWTYAIPVETSTRILPPSGAELSNEIWDNWRTYRKYHRVH